MSNVEVKEIGIEIGIDKGTFFNTEFAGNVLKLSQTSTSLSGKPIYHSSGHWESPVIDLVDKFKEYDRVILTQTDNSGSTVAVLTRTSDDGVSFTDYAAITPDGKVQSPIKRYIQIKISLFGGLSNEIAAKFDFNTPNDVNDWSNKEYLVTDGSLKLKRDFTFAMDNDPAWTSEGTLFRKSIKRSDYKKINSLKIY